MPCKMIIILKNVKNVCLKNLRIFIGSNNSRVLKKSFQTNSFSEVILRRIRFKQLILEKNYLIFKNWCLKKVHLKKRKF